MTRSSTEGAAAGEAIRAAVREQIETGAPAEARATFERLVTAGMTPDQAIECMAAVLASEMFTILKNQTPYDADRYEEALRALPRLPWE